MEKQKVPHRRLLVLLGCALLSPIIRVLPGVGAKVAGEAEWLVPLAALPFLLLEVWWVCSALRQTGGRLDGLYLTAFGKVGGRLACALSAGMLWLLLCGGLQFYGDRFVSTMYPDTGLGIFFVLMLVVVRWVSGKDLRVLADGGQLFFYASMITLAVVLLLSVGEVKTYHIWPVGVEDALPVLEGTLPLIGTLSIGVGAAFLTDQVALGSVSRTMKWCGGFCVGLSVVSLVTLGVFGAGTTAELQVPFFQLAKEASIAGTIQRLESVVSCVWVFSDILFLSLLVKGCAVAVGSAAGCPHQPLLSPLLLAAFPAGWLLAPNSGAMEEMFQRMVIYWEVGILVVLPLAAAVLVKGKR